jgi:hypothetical protein
MGPNDKGITRSFDPDNEKIRKVLITEIPEPPVEKTFLPPDFSNTLRDLEKLLETIKQTLPEYMEVVYNGNTYTISKDNPFIVVQKTEEEKNEAANQSLSLAQETFTSSQEPELSEPQQEPELSEPQPEPELSEPQQEQELSEPQPEPELSEPQPEPELSEPEPPVLQPEDISNQTNDLSTSEKQQGLSTMTGNESLGEESTSPPPPTQTLQQSP